MRLTFLYPNGNYYIRSGTLLTRAYNKLGQLENIEDEFGIDLVKVCLFALNGGYYKGESPLATPTNISPTDIVVNFLFKYFDCYDNCLSLYFKDYGKTWALTKEELK